MLAQVPNFLTDVPPSPTIAIEDSRTVRLLSLQLAIPSLRAPPYVEQQLEQSL